MSAKANLTKIPFPGGSGRVPSGALQFEDDWPGLFLRGDQAVALGTRIEGLVAALKEKKPEDPRVWTAMLELEKLAEVIARDVKVRS